jgi:hypothetical protein
MLVAVAGEHNLAGELLELAGQVVEVTAPMARVLQRLELQILEEEAAVSDLPPREALAVLVS